MAATDRRVGRALATAAAICAVALAVSACDIRREEPQPSVPAVSAYDLRRDAAAVAVQRLADAAAAEAPTGDVAHDRLLELVTAAAPEYVDAFGGVYVPYPSPLADGEVAATAFPEASAAPLGTFEDEVEAARVFLLEHAMGETDGELALLQFSAGLYLALAQFDAQAAAGATGDEEPLGPAERTPAAAGSVAFGSLLPAGPSLDAATLAELTVAHDRAVYIDDVVAARSTRTPRRAVGALALDHQRRAEALAAMLPEDPRGPEYAISAAALADVESRALLVEQVQREVGLAYVAAFAAADPQDRTWLAAGAYDAFANAIAWRGYSPLELGPFPGVAVS